ncbi:MAG: glycosyl transferase group 1 [Solirubrobacterales bacterium]|jgi:glycosyltransferase involved in cell wall biosynthesis|nr:glycosyl transferase group 1 [Solirubrobacterales bacterium]
MYTVCAMRILVVSTFYPPVALGGYEVECAGVVERLRERHDVRVLTSAHDRASVSHAEEGVARELALLSPNHRGALHAPRASVRAAGVARHALEWRPDLIYSWNGSSIPQSALRVLADSGVPLAFRVCEHWFGGIFSTDQFLRELLPGERGPARGAWAAGCRLVNALPSLRLDPRAPFRAAISWNSEALERMVAVPAFIDPVLERVGHSVPRYGDLYADVVRAPAAAPEIVFLGRVTPYKGLSVAIEALALLRSDRGIDASLVVVGPEDARHGREMRALAERLGVAGAIRWLGQQTPEQASGALARAHALIVPSTWDEPFPLVTIEGALARVPLVASDVGGIGEGMHDEEHALLFPRGDSAAAALALARVLLDGEETAARVARAHERAQAFRIGPYLEEQERFVEDALSAWRQITVA